MSAKGENVRDTNIESLPSQRSTAVTDELTRVMDLVKGIVPPDTHVSFAFDGKLHMHIDIRKLEDVTRVEAILPTLGAGLFSDIQRGSTPNHSFFHRLSARVDR